MELKPGQPESKSELMEGRSKGEHHYLLGPQGQTPVPMPWPTSFGLPFQVLEDPLALSCLKDA